MNDWPNFMKLQSLKIFINYEFGAAWKRRSTFLKAREMWNFRSGSRKNKNGKEREKGFLKARASLHHAANFSDQFTA